MSTRVPFDLAGLHRAVESGDAAYCTAMYADRAELRVVDSEQPADPPGVLAEVDRGQIARETAVMSEHRSPSDRAPAMPGVAPDGLAVMVDQSPGSTPDPPPPAPSPGTALARHVPGYYLG